MFLHLPVTSKHSLYLMLHRLPLARENIGDCAPGWRFGSLEPPITQTATAPMHFAYSSSSSAVRKLTAVQWPEIPGDFGPLSLSEEPIEVQI